MTENIKASCEIPPKAISIATITNGKLKQFYVESGSGKCYMVSINDTNHANYHLFQNIMLENGFVNMRRFPLLTDLPFCDALTGKSIIYHVSMFAVMKKSGMSWESFPTRYRDSPFLKTDFDSFDRDDDNKQNNNSTQSSEAICYMEEENGRQNLIYSELFQKQWPKKTVSTSCRYFLKQIKDHTYIVNDKTVLEDVEERLENILQIMKNHCSAGFGFLINSSLEKPVNEK